MCPMADHYSAALVHVGEAQEARAHLTDLYRFPEHDRRVVASLNADLGEALKLAEIHALLDVGQGLRDLRSSIEASR